MMKRKTSILFTFLAVLFSTGCATESHNLAQVESVETYRSNYQGPRAALVVGNFQNRSGYQQGIFSSKTDRLGNQAKTILKTHLQQTNRFSIVDRENLQLMQSEAALRGESQNIKGARYTISGDVTEFGRKVTGDKQLFGILGKGKTQTAYAKVSMLVLDNQTSEIVYSTQAAGEYELSNREVIGFGGTAKYDSTLNGKVLNFAIKEAVNNLVRDINNGIWVVSQ